MGASALPRIGLVMRAAYVHRVVAEKPLVAPATGGARTALGADRR